MPAQRGRGAVAFLLTLGGVLAVLHLLSQAHPSASGPARPDGDVARTALYGVELLGGFFGERSHPVLVGGGATLAASAAALLWLRRRTVRQDRFRAAVVLFGFSALSMTAFAYGRHHLGIDWATASFHAAPLLTPFALGMAVLLGASPRAAPSTGRRLDSAVAAGAVLLLAVACVNSWPYGITRARLWAMDRGYARWATCSGQVPEVVAARGSGVAYDLGAFSELLPTILQMCGSPAGPLEATLVRRPPLFDALAAKQPGADRALDALWQDYATMTGLQIALKPWQAAMPERLLSFARVDADKGSEIDPARLGPHADVYRALSP